MILIDFLRGILQYTQKVFQQKILRKKGNQNLGQMRLKVGKSPKKTVSFSKNIGYLQKPNGNLLQNLLQKIENTTTLEVEKNMLGMENTPEIKPEGLEEIN